MSGVDGLQPPFHAAFTTLATFMFFFLFGHLRDFIRRRLQSVKVKKGYAPIRQDFEDFYTRRMYYRLHDCWNRPIASAPDAWIDIMQRTQPKGSQPLEPTNKLKRCLNLGSYNYLGFAAADEYCTPRVIQALKEYGCSMCSSRIAAGKRMVWPAAYVPDCHPFNVPSMTNNIVGNTKKHVELDRLVAEFVRKEDAITFGMGFATNSVVIPALVSKGCLVISDALNHASIVTGVRASGAKVKVFAHNDMLHLEALLRENIAYGQPRTRRPWKKILIIVEGIYSMEGELCPLPQVIELRKKYKAYVFLDEAHSIGAMGKHGRGVCEHWGVDPADVDVMMGTFTKSFGSCGGYIAGPKVLIQCLRRIGPGHCYATSMSVPAVEQVITAMHVLEGRDGSSRGVEKIARLHDNANFVRRELQAMGCAVLGDDNSPVTPVMLFNPGKIVSTSRELLKRGIAMVVVGFPATPLLSARARICISASHSQEDLEWALEVIDEVAGICCLRYSSPSKAVKMITPDPLVLDGDEPEAAESRDEAQLLVSED